MLEYEKKVLLTAEEYDSIMKLLGEYASVESQTNYYFDTDDLSMNKKGTTCRIRAKNGKFKATMKRHNTSSPDCSMEADLVEKTEFDPQIFKVFGLHYQGELVTERVVLHKDNVCEMVLDRNVYLGYTDFELEVEYCKGSERRAQMLIENIANHLISVKLLTEMDEFVSRIGRDGCKSQRFFERLESCK